MHFKIMMVYKDIFLMNIIIIYILFQYSNIYNNHIIEVYLLFMMGKKC